MEVGVNYQDKAPQHKKGLYRSPYWLAGSHRVIVMRPASRPEPQAPSLCRKPKMSKMIAADIVSEGDQILGDLLLGAFIARHPLQDVPMFCVVGGNPGFARHMQ